MKEEHLKAKKMLEEEYKKSEEIEGWNSERFQAHSDHLRSMERDFWENSFKRRDAFEERLNKTLSEEEELLRKIHLEEKKRLDDAWEEENSKITNKIREIDESIERLNSNLLKKLRTY